MFTKPAYVCHDGLGHCAAQQQPLHIRDLRILGPSFCLFFHFSYHSSLKDSGELNRPETVVFSFATVYWIISLVSLGIVEKKLCWTGVVTMGFEEAVQSCKKTSHSTCASNLSLPRVLLRSTGLIVGWQLSPSEGQATTGVGVDFVGPVPSIKRKDAGQPAPVRISTRRRHQQ